MHINIGLENEVKIISREFSGPMLLIRTRLAVLLISVGASLVECARKSRNQRSGSGHNKGCKTSEVREIALVPWRTKLGSGRGHSNQFD
jgi:hypothetical protein